jgi:hypothetical protein
MGRGMLDAVQFTADASFVFRSKQWKPYEFCGQCLADLMYPVFHHHQWHYSPGRALASITGFRDG